jgi:dimethylargininase
LEIKPVSPFREVSFTFQEPGMKHFTHAIVKSPCKNLANGLTSAGLGIADFQRATCQHKAYIDALENLGLNVKILEPDEQFPDSTFVEDTALLTPEIAILTRPGAISRRGEVTAIKKAIKCYYDEVETIVAPGTVDAGDIMMVGATYYIGISQRTNPEGAGQICQILQKAGMKGITVPLAKMLHLKSGLSYLENDHLVISGEFIGKPVFAHFKKIEVSEKEQYAANCLWINGTVLLASGFPLLSKQIRARGYPVIELDMSEFQKLDGGMSCLSLRF